jgi:endonuclease G, mitochondrial
MTGQGSRRFSRTSGDEEEEAALQSFLRRDGLAWLAHPNVAGMMFGKKSVAGQETDEDAVIFRVHRKLADRADILAVGSKPFPEYIQIAGRRFVTDVLEGAHRPNDGGSVSVDPRQRFPFICAGVSIGNAGVAADAGTGTAVVRHLESGRLALLSCDHVLGRRDGNGKAVQPGRLDNAGSQDVFGTYLAGMRGLDGDAAIASIERRPAEFRIPNLSVAIEQIGTPRIGDLVVKAGRSTGVSYGVVSKSPALMWMPYDDSAPEEIQGFEIRTLAGATTERGDSGAPWLLADPQTRRPRPILVGIHLSATPDRTDAFACLPSLVFRKLGIEIANASDSFAPSLIASEASTLHSSGTDLFRVTARSGLELRTGASREFSRLLTLPFGTVVRRVGIVGDWSKVDLAGDGAADGFVYTPFLQSVDQ